MRLLLDENLCRRRLIALLKDAGHDVATVAELLRFGASDRSVAEAAVREVRVLLTEDAKDFRQLYADYESHPGLLLAYPDRATPMANAASVAAVRNVAATYPNLSHLILALNDFVW